MRKPIIFLLLISALTLAIAYQFRAPIELEMTSPAEESYLTPGFYSNEETAGVTFRWTSGDAQVILPGVGEGAPLKLHLQLQELRPAPLSPHPVTVSLNGHEVTSFTPSNDLAAYDFDLPGSDLRGDVDNVKRMREALGPDVAIMIDINQGWTADVAINQGRKIVDYDVYWLEEPVPADDFAGYQRIAAALRLRVVGGALGVIVDARGRPVHLPPDPIQRRELINKWRWMLGC